MVGSLVCGPVPVSGGVEGVLVRLETHRNYSQNQRPYGPFPSCLHSVHGTDGGPLVGRVSTGRVRGPTGGGAEEVGEKDDVGQGSRRVPVQGGPRVWMKDRSTGEGRTESGPGRPRGPSSVRGGVEGVVVQGSVEEGSADVWIGERGRRGGWGRRGSRELDGSGTDGDLRGDVFVDRGYSRTGRSGALSGRVSCSPSLCRSEFFIGSFSGP